MKTHRLHILLGGLALALSAGAHADDIVPGRLLVKFRNGVSESRAAALTRGFGGRESRRIPMIGVRVLQLPANANPRALAARMASMPEVAFAEPDRTVSTCEMIPNDPWFNLWQPSLRIINAPAAWSLTTGSAGVVIAVLDTGVYSGHPDLAGKIVPGWNVVDGNSNTDDVNGHGTSVAGVAAACGNNGLGVASVAWNCRVMPIRVADSYGVASYSALAAGVVWATQHGAKVVNMSFHIERNSTLESALSSLRAAGGLAVCGSGNDGSNTGEGNNPYIVTASGTDPDDQISVYSSYGNNVDICAPISSYTLSRNGGYTSAGGTSYSAPLVAGTAALIMSVNPNLSSADIENVLFQSADDRGAPGWDPYYGWGRLNVGSAVLRAMGTTPVDSTPPAVSITSPSDNARVHGAATIWATASDNNSVDSVEFYVDGAAMGASVGTPYSVTWDSSKVADGAHVLSAVAKDLAGNRSESKVTVNVSNFIDTICPQIAITSPQTGDRLGRAVKVTVSTSDNVRVVRVEAYLDGALVASSTAAPFSLQFSAKSLSAGLHDLQVKSYDAAGNCGSSATISVRK